jgi:unsaturated rhamnogalacturonyl hydrolase
MRTNIVRRMIERGFAAPVDTGGKHSALLNAIFLGGFSDWLQEKVDDVLAKPVISHPALADSSSRIRPLVLAGRVKEALEAAEVFRRERVVAGGVTQHTTAPSTQGWVFADSAYMVPPSQAIVGATELALSELKGFYRLLVNDGDLMRHVLNANVPLEKSVYAGIDLWIDGTAWGRANGWWVAGVVDSLEVLPRAEWDAELLAMFQRTADALISHQDGGFWRCTIDDPYAPVDTSATVMIAYGLLKGYQLGLGDQALECAAFAALESTLRHHFDWRTATLRHQQYGPMVVNIPSTNPRYLVEGNPYGQGFLAALYSLGADGVDVRSLGVQRVKPKGAHPVHLAAGN